MARVSIIEDVEGTRQALIRAGLDLFGRNGFDATSTREIAQAAGVNSAGIAYHFGGKDGL
ncbi:MAG: TetR family transcriptional regulator, partial [Bosea sp.]|nr:TetR family transcriptional regulator [Bosea sp. (in: a-proteobacteria)]